MSIKLDLRCVAVELGAHGDEAADSAPRAAAMRGTAGTAVSRCAADVGQLAAGACSFQP